MSAALVPPGIDGANTRALARLLERWDTLGVERVLVWHTDSVAEDILPHLADTLGTLEVRYVAGPPREALRGAIAKLRARGTGGAIRRAIEALGHTGIVLRTDTRQEYDGEIMHDGKWRYGADRHWAVFFAYVDSPGPMDVADVRELWDEIVFAASRRDQLVLVITDTVGGELTVYREAP